MRSLLFVMVAILTGLAAAPSSAQQAAPAPATPQVQTYAFPTRERGPGFGTTMGVVLGGLAGSAYQYGVAATGSAVGAAVVNTVYAVGTGVSTAASSAVAVAGLPVVVGVVAGGAMGYFIASR